MLVSGWVCSEGATLADGAAAAAVLPVLKSMCISGLRGFAVSFMGMRKLSRNKLAPTSTWNNRVTAKPLRLRLFSLDFIKEFFDYYEIRRKSFRESEMYCGS